ncbi:unnamed protein product, partial [Brassica oleracea]
IHGYGLESIRVLGKSFEEVPQLVTGIPFKIYGVLKPKLLSPDTQYSAYVVYKAKDQIQDVQKSFGVGVIVHETPEGAKWERLELTKLEKREDGWVEAKFGELLNDGGFMDDRDEIWFRISEIKYSYWTPGFIIQGIEFRPVKKIPDAGDLMHATMPSPFDSLPVDCISTIISFTSPRDACVAASISKTFESAVKSDTVWEKFLPSEYSSLIPQYSRVFMSKKELYFALCDDPVLIEDGKKSFWLEKASGKRCIMLSLKESSITWGTSPQYWRWISIPESRFEKIAELLNVCWFDIGDGMHTRYLSPRTHYSVYIVFKTKNGCPNLGDSPVDVGVGLVGQEPSQKLIYFIGPPGRGRGRRRRRETETRDVTRPEAREDGWMEAELGEFYNDSCCDDISFSIIKTNTPHWKSGLIVQGIEFRPAKVR